MFEITWRCPETPTWPKHDQCSTWKGQIKILHLKCMVISFSESSCFYHNYVLNNYSLERVTVVKDLDVYFDDELYFAFHIYFVSNGAIRLLYYILWISKDFKKPETLITFYSFINKPVPIYPTRCCHLTIILTVIQLNQFYTDVKNPLPYTRRILRQNYSAFSLNTSNTNISFKSAECRSCGTINSSSNLYKFIISIFPTSR